MRHFVALALVLACGQSGLAQVVSDRTAEGCVAAAGAGAAVDLEGRLTTATSEGPAGEERFYLLALSEPLCIDDGGDFADPAVRFSEVQLGGTDKATWRDMRQSKGRMVKVRGTAFAAHTIHHHRPMVVIVETFLPPTR